MNQLNKYSSIHWYIEKIKELIIDKRYAPKNRPQFYIDKEHKYSQYLLELGITLSNFSSPINNSIFESFITAEYSDLEKILSINYNPNDSIPQHFLKLYNKFSPNNINYTIIQNSNIQVCPYCNENYIINRGQNHTSAQLDHFWSKATHPLFSICLYNLIPCCYSCNHIKTHSPLNVSPYNENICRDQLKITFSPSSSDFLTNNNSLSIDFLPHGEDGKLILDDLKQLKIDESYKYHTDQLIELLKKSYVYNQSTIKELEDLFGNTISSEEELYRLIFGNYIDSDNLNTRPLAKLTQDILKELLIIK